MKRIYSILLAGVMTAGLSAVGHAGEYNNVTDLAKFEAALGEQAQYGAYRNIITRERFEAGLADGTQFGAYRNMTSRESFILALGDQFQKGAYDSERMGQRVAAHGAEGVADRDMIVNGRWIGPFEQLPVKAVYHASESYGLL